MRYSAGRSDPSRRNLVRQGQRRVTLSHVACRQMMTLPPLVKVALQRKVDQLTMTQLTGGEPIAKEGDTYFIRVGNFNLVYRLDGEHAVIESLVDRALLDGIQ
jgi:hypothetical protein